MIDTTRLHWAAGLAEGEACFTITEREGEATPQFSLKMTDLDVLTSFAEVLGLPAPKPAPQGGERNPNWQPLFAVRLSGRRAVGLMLTLYPLLHARRQARIHEVLMSWRARPYTRRRRATHQP